MKKMDEMDVSTTITSFMSENEPLTPPTNNTVSALPMLHEFTHAEYVFWFGLYGLIAVMAVLGNSLVIFIIGTRKIMQNVPNYFILNLAVADLITGLIAIPFKFQAVLQQRWTLPAFMCSLLTFVETLSLGVNVFTLTGGAIDRFMIVIVPTQWKMSRKAAFQIITSIWVLSIACSVPFGLLHKSSAFLASSQNLTILTDQEIAMHTEDELIWRCLPLYMDSKYWNWYNIYLTIIQYFVPLIIIDGAYSCIACRVWGSMDQSGCRRFQKDRSKVVKLLILVVILFTFCWFPYETYLLLCEVTPQINNHPYINVIFMCLHCLAMSNSALNPIIYGVFNAKFRREYRRVFNLMLRRNQPLSSMIMSFRNANNNVVLGGNIPASTQLTATGNGDATDTNDFIAGELGY